MRVAFVIDRWQPRRGGAEQALAHFARHLEGHGHEVHAFGRAGPRDGEEAPGRFHALRVLALRRATLERRFAEAALAAAEREGCELTLGVRHLPRVDLFWPHGGSHAETLALAGKPVRGRHRAFVELERELLEGGGARLVACVSELVREELARRYPSCAPRLRVVPAGVDLERFHPARRGEARARLLERLGGVPRGPLVGFAARDARLKGLDTLLEALSALRELPWTLVVGGPKRARVWIARARRLGLGPERVRVFADLPSIELAAGVDLAALPTRRDTVSLYLLEALACGTPVLASARAGASACITAGAGEVIADPEDRGRWSAALRAWIERASSARIDPDAARRGVEGRGLGRWMEGMEALLLELSAERPLG